MNITTQTKTQAVILEMLLENTGKSMLDSGGAYGRSWERNQTKGAEAITEAPAVTFDYGSPVLSVYHFLTEHLEFSPVLDAAWLVWDDTHPDDSWRENVETFLDLFGVAEEGGFYESGRMELNTYNFEYCLLDQTIQFTKFDIANAEYLALQIHGGCDVRGGYTKPRIFQVRDFAEFFMDSESGSVGCSNCGVSYYFRCGEIEANTQNAEDTETVEALNDSELRNWFGTYETQNACPNCKLEELKG